MFLSTTFLAIAASFTPSYDDAYNRAEREGKPLVIFVGQKSREIKGAVSVSVPDYNDSKRPRVLMAKDGKLAADFLPHDASEERIQAAIDGQAPIADGAVEALEEVNAVRASRGLRPYARDDGLTLAAISAAKYRAERGIAGHVPGQMGDFAFLPAGSDASATGCAAWPASLGWGSCCTYEGWTRAGAAYSVGKDGQRYMHLFVR